jgi:hypothetical protein
MQAEREIIENALRAFQQATGLKLDKIAGEDGYPKQQRGAAMLRLQTVGARQRFVVEYRRALTQQTLGVAIRALEKVPEKGMLVTEYVNPRIAEQLKNMGIPFIDTVGNAFINDPPIYIYVTGNKPARTEHTQLGKTFHPAGLKVLFVMLCNDRVVEEPLRAIADLAGVALGTVARVVEDMKKRGYLLEFKDGRRRLVNKQELLQQWTLLYPTILRPKLIEGRYVATEQNWWNGAELNALWGGEVAAAKLTKYIKPATTTIYTYQPTAKLIVQHKLRPSKEGKVEILRAFWDEELNPQKTLVPPLMVYTDLMATGEPRSIETAKIIYEQELAGHFRED